MRFAPKGLLALSATLAACAAAAAEDAVAVGQEASMATTMPVASSAQSPPASQAGVDVHVPPAPPQQSMQAMSEAAMTEVMQMDDRASFAMFKLDELERTHGDAADATVWNAQAWYGGDFDKLWLRTEGEREAGVNQARLEAFWDHAFASYWDWQLGVRNDFGHVRETHFDDGTAAQRNVPDRTWAALGLQGLAPYWFDIEATVYVGEQGRSAARFRAEYELLLTQRLILQPELEVNLYGRRERSRDVAAGLSDAEFGLRLRYEIRRQFAPYVGVVRAYSGAAAIGAESTGQGARNETRVVAGLRVWF